MDLVWYFWLGSTCRVSTNICLELKRGLRVGQWCNRLEVSRIKVRAKAKLWDWRRKQGNINIPVKNCEEKNQGIMCLKKLVGFCRMEHSVRTGISEKSAKWAEGGKVLHSWSPGFSLNTTRKKKEKKREKKRFSKHLIGLVTKIILLKAFLDWECMEPHCIG